MDKQWEMTTQTYTREVPTCSVCGEQIKQESAISFLTGSAKCGCGTVWVGKVSGFSGCMNWDTIRRVEPDAVEAALWNVKLFEEVN